MEILIYCIFHFKALTRPSKYNLTRKRRRRLSGERIGHSWIVNRKDTLHNRLLGTLRHSDTRRKHPQTQNKKKNQKTKSDYLSVPDFDQTTTLFTYDEYHVVLLSCPYPGI